MKYFFALLAISLLSFGNGYSKNINIEKSEFKWKGKKIIGDSHWGYLLAKSGNVEVIDGKITTGTIVIDMKTMTNEDLEKGSFLHKKLLKHLKSKDFFDIKEYPETSITINTVGDDGKVFASLTIKEMSFDISFDASFSTESGVETITGMLIFNRANFYIEYGSGSFIDNLGDRAISDDVTVEFKLVLE